MADEIAWVYDSYIFQLRVSQDPILYKYDKSYLDGSWADIKTRIVDQPQFGKYLYGFLLRAFRINLDYEEPPLFNTSSDLYSRFGYYWNELSGQNLDEISRELGGPKWVEAIVSMRYVSFAFFISILIVHGCFIFLLTKDLVISLVSVGLLSVNKLFVYFSQVATMDLPALFMAYVSVAVFFYAQKIQIRKTFVRRLLFSVSGILVAIAATTKLNGFFLIFLPLFFFNRRRVTSWLFEVFYFYIGFLATLGIVERAVLNNLQSLLVLFFARLRQQSFFLLSNDILNPLEYLQFVVLSMFENYGLFIFVLIGLLLIKYFVYLKKKVIVLGKLKLKPFQKSMGLFAIYLVVTNYYYARVGFERYLMIIHVLLVIMATYSLYKMKRNKQL